MVEVIPALMPKTRSDLAEHAARVIDLVPLVQLDVMDGKFVGSASWPYGGHEREFMSLAEKRGMLPHADKIDYEIDLMVRDPEHVVEEWMHLRPRRIVIHIESTRHMDNILRDVAAHVTRSADEELEVVSLGVAIGTVTPVSSIESYVNDVDFVQCMGIAEIGKQGEPFDERVLSQIRLLRERYPELIISVDGGVHADTAPQLVQAGVRRLVSGSAIWESNDVAAVIRQLAATGM